MGLPARGKTFTATKLTRYLRWLVLFLERYEWLKDKETQDIIAEERLFYWSEKQSAFYKEMLKYIDKTPMCCCLKNRR